MTSKVFIAYLNDGEKKRSNQKKIEELFERAEFSSFINEEELFAVKVHVGETGLNTYVNPIFLRPVVEKIKGNGAKPFLTDTNTLYSGTRHFAPDHINTAISHGFGNDVTGAPFIVADGLKGDNYDRVKIEKKHFFDAAIAKDIVNSDGMIVFSHFKGHELAGFGGAIKNLAMGCAPPEGKKEQHGIKIHVSSKKCIKCGRCVETCPEKAIFLEEDGKAKINPSICVGCGECMTVCPVKAITLDWRTEIDSFLERMTEYAYAAIANKKDKVGYITLVASVTPYCDCVPWSDAPLVADVGFLASKDPVAIDQAALDLVNAQKGLADSALGQSVEKGEDKFLALRPHVDGRHALKYAESIGMGSRKYELIKI